MAIIPKLAMIPSGYKDGKLYSVLPSDGVGDFDVTRGSNATRINKDGLIETVTGNTPRLNYPLIDGVVNGCPSLLLEASSTNRVPNSTQFSGTETGVSVLRNQIISPDGTLNADRVLDNNNSGEHLITGSYSGSITSGLDYTASAFFKSDGTTGQGVIRSYTGSWQNAVFNLEDGTIPYTSNGVSKIENYGNGWYRCSLRVTATTNYGNTIIQLAIGNSSNQYSYQGASSLGVYFWGVQFEQSSFPTSYIPTTSSQVTRLAETANNAGNASTFNDSEGVLFAEISAFDDSTKQFSISNGTSASSVKFLYLSGNVFSFQVRDNLATQCSISKTLSNVNENIKAAGKYKKNDFALWVNGFKVNIDTTGTVPIGLSELAYDDGGGGSTFHSLTKQLQYYNTALTDAELETLTSYTSFNAMALAQNYKIQ